MTVKNLIKPLGLMFLAVTLTNANAKAQLNRSKALYVYFFAKNIVWPGDSKQIVVSVIGDNDFANELAKVVSTKQVGNLPITVRRVPTVASVPKSQIIYLGEPESASISELIESQKGNKVLIISGKKGQCHMGAAISFLPENGKIDYEISGKNIRKSGLVCSQNMILHGKSVD